jgi:hypothetical protein
MFMMKAPEFDASPLSELEKGDVKRAFVRGTADKYPARTLVRAGVFKYHPLRGGIYWRREPIKHIIMHSTETGIPVSGVRVIESWSSMGRRHPGAQFVVDRDGTIYLAVDPDLATVHINILKTLPGIDNDNSIGIEMNHTGRQDYPEAQLTSVIRLVTYLQDRYQIKSEDIVTHRYAQQGDHTDPVRFDWRGFLTAKDRHRNDALAFKMDSMRQQSSSWGDYTQTENLQRTDISTPNTLLQPHVQVEGIQVVPDRGQPARIAPAPYGTATSGFTSSTGGAANGATGAATTATSAAGAVANPAGVANRTGAVNRAGAAGSPAGMPQLRGPIEVGPEHASEIKTGP